MITYGVSKQTNESIKQHLDRIGREWDYLKSKKQLTPKELKHYQDFFSVPSRH